MSNKASKLTKHYCESFISAASVGATSHCEFLASQPEFSETYVDKKRGHIIKYIALSGNQFILSKSIDNSLNLDDNSDFLNLVLSAVSSGNLNCVKIVVDNIDKLRGNSKRHYQYGIDFALRKSGELGYIEIFDYLLTIGAKPNQWHVLRWTADKGPDITYNRLLETNKLPSTINRKDLIELCERKFLTNDWEYIDLSILK